MIDLFLIRPEHLWYTVGLITTDGNLSSDGRHINISSKDIDLLTSVQTALHLKTKIILKANGYSKIRKYGALQFSDVHFYRFLCSLGLTPRKSLTLQSIAVDKKYFRDFLRGVIDGDGGIRRWLHPSNGKEQWELRIYSAAEFFSNWLYKEIVQHFGVKGALFSNVPKRQNKTYAIKFGKMAAQKILSECYGQSTLSLARKHTLALQCVAATKGWKKNVNCFIVVPKPRWRNWLYARHLKCRGPKRPMWVRLPLSAQVCLFPIQHRSTLSETITDRL